MAFSANDSGSGAPKADINVVPLVDVLLVLLIIFMVTAPLMSHKIEVELPEANLDQTDEIKNKVQPITLAVTEEGDVYWNDQAVTRDVLESQQIGRASCRESVCQYVEISVVAVSLKKKSERREVKEANSTVQ